MSNSPAPVIVWFRRDLRLADNPALAAAADTGRSVIPLYVFDETEGVRAPGGAAVWWLNQSLRSLAEGLEGAGSKLVLRRGEAAAVVEALARDLKAEGVFWNRLHAPDADARDDALAARLKAQGMKVEIGEAALLTDPAVLRTKVGGPFKVYTPFWRTARARIDPGAAHPAPKRLHAPSHWPKSEPLPMAEPKWAAGFDVWAPGQAGAAERLDRFIDDALADYPKGRDLPAVEGSSRLSPHLHWGEIGPRQVWRSLDLAQEAQPGIDNAVEKFRAELGWREFNHHLLAAQPDLATRNFKSAFEHFPWRKDNAALQAWREGRTGYPLVDAGMRQLWHEGFMHNRVRMVVASFLIKHLLIDWREGEAWFWDTLVDADEANNPANWQWVAGSGADAQPFFRIFNPTAQAERYDQDGDYIRRWIPELAQGGEGYPMPIVDHGAARARALAALKALRETEAAE
ncbi:MAG: deoxyribodipyrimidine photo-lyase [Caulobacteraceae bacterium]